MVIYFFFLLSKATPARSMENTSKVKGELSQNVSEPFRAYALSL